MRFTKLLTTPIALALCAALAACNSSNSNGILGTINSKAQVVFVNGSPDAGAVQVIIDNQEQFCTGSNVGAACAIAYGQLTPVGAVQLPAGNHTISFKDVNGNAISVSNGSFAVNGGGTYSVVLAGELHPSYGSASTLTVAAFNDQPFTSSPAVNIHQASPYVQSLNGSTGVQFGYYTGGNVSTATPLGSATAFGSETTPQPIPSSAQNTQITFYAMSPTSGFTAGPSVADQVNCAGNQLPCSNTSGHMSLYLIDGPAASTTPTTPPTGVSATARAIFVGAFVP